MSLFSLSSSAYLFPCPPPVLFLFIFTSETLFTSQLYFSSLWTSTYALIFLLSSNRISKCWFLSRCPSNFSEVCIFWNKCTTLCPSQSFLLNIPLWAYQAIIIKTSLKYLKSSFGSHSCLPHSISNHTYYFSLKICTEFTLKEFPLFLLLLCQTTTKLVTWNNTDLSSSCPRGQVLKINMSERLHSFWRHQRSIYFLVFPRI